MLILDGKEVAKARQELLRPRVAAFTARWGRKPHLCVVMVGDHSASQVYVRNKIKACQELGLQSTLVHLPETLSQKDLEQKIAGLNQDDAVDGILVQLPLPSQLNEKRVLELMDPRKDVDGFSFKSLGYLFAGQKIIAPCTPQGIIHLLQHYQIPIAGTRAVVVGRSIIVGKPMAELLTQENATVTLCHSKTKNVREYTSQADLVIVAAGRRHLLGKDDFKKDSVVIDVGMHGAGSKDLAGDVRFAELQGWVRAASPVPGGVGPMTISTLLENTVTLAEKRMGR